MYLDYFSLKRHPFRITPDPSLFYHGGVDGRGVILHALIYGITSGEGILKVVGEVGSGKTMLCRMLEEELPDTVEIVYIANPRLTAREILYAIAIELKLEVTASTERLKVLHLIQDYLLKKHANGNNIVVFIEEAQSMPVETLEEIRLLSNLETSQHKLMQIVLFGQPELDKTLAEKNIRQLRERITHSFSLDPLTPQTTSEYLRYRLKAAGCPRPQLFSSRAEKMIARASSGLTRRINILADKSLLAAYADSPSRQPHQDSDEPLVLPRHVRAAVRDSDYRSSLLNPWWLMGTGAGLLAIVAGFFIFELMTQNSIANFPGNEVVSLSSDSESQENEIEMQLEEEVVIQGIVNRDASEPEPEPEPDLEVMPTAAALIANAENAIAPEIDIEITQQQTIIQEEADAVAVAIDSIDTLVELSSDDTTPVESVSVASDSEQVEKDEQVEQVEQIEVAEPVQLVIAEPIEIQEPTTPLPEPDIEQATQTASVSEQNNVPTFLTAPVAVVPRGLTELRMAPTANWLRQVEGEAGYTIKLFSVPSTNPNGLEEYLQFLQLISLLNDTYICFMPISSANSGRWQVMHKQFEGVTPARNFINDLPVYVQQYDPFVMNLDNIQCSYPVSVSN